MVCGEICRQFKLGPDPGFSAVLAGPDPENGARRILTDTVDRLMIQSRQELDSGMRFSLLLPDEDEPIGERTGSLADWVRGFVLALLRGERLTLQDLDSNSAEIVQDLLKIGEAQPGEEGEDDEKALAEIEEYVRVGVQLVFEEMQPDGQPQEKGEVH